MLAETLDARSVAEGSVGWHRKWLLLCAVLVFVFFLRFRLLGWLLSQLVTLALRIKAPKLGAHAHIQYAKLSPFELGHIEIRGCQNDWRFVCTRVTTTTRVLEFFRSFVQKKMLELSIEDVYVDIVDVDEQILRELVGQAAVSKSASSSSASGARTTTASKKKRNPMGFMRFIDLRIRSIHMNVDCFDTRNSFRCSDLKIDIPEVFVAQNYLHLSVEASAIVASSHPLDSHSESKRSGAQSSLRLGARPSSDEEFLSCDLPILAAVFNVRLTDQEVIGCSIEGEKTDPAYFHVSTAYVERLLQEKMELIKRGLISIPKWLWTQDSGLTPSSTGSLQRPSSSFALRIVEFPVTMDIVHRSSTGAPKVPLHLALHCTRLQYLKGPPEPSTRGSTSSGNGVQISLNWRSIALQTIPAMDGDLLSLAAIEMDMQRDDSGRGTVHARAEGLHLAVNPPVCEVLHSLVLFPDTIDEYERLTLQLMMDIVAQKQARSTLPLQRKAGVEWSVAMEIDSWRLRSWLDSMENSKRDLEAHGNRLSLESIVPPKSSSTPIKHNVTASDARVSIANHTSATHEDYRIDFDGITVSTMKTVANSAKAMEVAFSASTIVVNSPSESPSRPLPRFCLSTVSLQLNERTATDGSTRMALAISMAEADVISSHQQHQQILGEATQVLHVIDKVRIMLTPPEPGDKSGSSLKPEPVETSSNILVTKARFQLEEITGVTPCIEFTLTETKVAVQKTPLGSTSAVSCAVARLQWADMSPATEVSGLKIDHTASAPGNASAGSDLLSPSATARSSITISRLKLWLQPGRKLLLLLLKLDELVNAKEVASASKKPSKQAIDFSCSAVAIKIPSASGEHVENDVVIEQLDVTTVMSKVYELTDAVQRYLELTRRDEQCRAQLIDCGIQVLGVDGGLSVHSVVVASHSQPLICIRGFQLQYAMSDVLLLGKSQMPVEQKIPPRFLVFDASVFANRCNLHASACAKTALSDIAPVFVDAFDTREPSVDAAETETTSDWRRRFVGSLDCGVERLVVSSPCEGDVFQSESDGGDRFLQLHVNDVAFACRQFQKLTLQLATTRLLLSERESEDDTVFTRPVAYDDANLPLQLIFLPRAKVDSVIHWKDTATHQHGTQQFAVSFDLVLRGKTASADTLVPTEGDTLIALNWDYVYPLLVYLLTSEDDESSETAATSPAPRAMECIGVQWNLSIDLVQLAWWDAVSQDACILMVCNDALSHGIARLHADRSGSPPKWVVWETTVYVDLFRVYILRESPVDSDSLVELTCGALPFRPVESSRFFIEAAGVSYRSTHETSGEIDDDASDTLFSDQGCLTTDQVHKQFAKVAYAFAIGAVSRLHRMDSVPPSATSFQQPSITTAPASSPPKSPRAWTQSVRTKLARLKRRTSSMDNLLVNDGSRPIQVDSMKLLWTIETRDCAFYMIAVTSDSLEAIIEANKSNSTAPESGSPAALNAEGKQSVNRPPMMASKSTGSEDEAKAEGQRNTRRGSTRVTLLDLLHQGKLGMKDPSSSSSSLPSSSSSMEKDTLPAKTEKDRFESDEMQTAKHIKFKLYTLDVHDAQINMLDETTRSSALIASKHIHLDIGLDEYKATTIATLTFDCVTGHVAPIDVDISVGVLWYSYSRSPASPRSTAPVSSPLLLKQVMDECTLSSTYSQTLATGATAVEADMSSLHLSTDRHQFYQLLNVLRHVLLAPPNVVRRAKKLDKSHRSEVSSTVSLDSNSDTTATAPTTPAPPLTKKTHHQLVDELRLRDSRQLGTVRGSQSTIKLISFRAAGCVFRFRTSPETTGGDHEFVEIRAEGITGSHSFFLSQSTKLVLNLQWMEINNLRPGSSSIAFEDAMAVLKAKLLVDQRYQSSRRVPLANQKGMLSVRAEGGPQMRVLGQKLRVLDVLEISVFPEIPNMIVIQLAADFYELVYKFFFEPDHQHHHHQLHDSEHVLFGKKGSLSSMGSGGGGTTSPSNSSSSSATPTTVAASPLSPMIKPRAYTTAATSPPHPPPLTIRRKSIQTSNSIVSSSESTLVITANGGSSNTSSLVNSPTGEATTGDEDDATSEGHELFYFKYVRIGNVRLRINCNGFFVNLTNFDLDLPPYVCQSKLCTWKKLLQKFESHLKWHVTKESASSGLSHFKNKLLKWTPASVTAEKKDKHKKEEDAATMNAQVLFGPYSGH